MKRVTDTVSRGRSRADDDRQGADRRLRLHHRLELAAYPDRLQRGPGHRDPPAAQVSINGGGDLTAPFGGYKMSGNEREWDDFDFRESLETKAILGYVPKVAAE
jgi:hypothetical protein